MRSERCFACLLVALLIGAGSCGASTDDPELQLEEMRSLIVAFEGEADSKGEASADGKEIRFLGHAPSGVYGRLVRVGYGDALYGFSPDLEIVEVRYPEREREHLRTPGEPDAAVPQKERVQVTKADALEAARRFVEAHWNSHVFEDVALDYVKLHPTGSTYEYGVSWSRVSTGIMIVRGLKRVFAWVNAETGRVFAVECIEAPPVAHPKIDAQRTREILREQFAEVQGLRVKYMQLAWGYKDGVRRPLWTADVRFYCPDRAKYLYCQGIGMLELDANTGEILIKTAQ